MYEDHFGLKSRPFCETVAPGAYVAVPSRDAALRRLRFGLDRGSGPVLLFGGPGSGKTILTRVLAQELELPTVVLAFPVMPAGELISYLAHELDPAAPIEGMAAAVRRVRTVLTEMAARGQRPLVIVDEAHLIEDATVFETLRLFLNFTTDGVPDLLLLIAGGPEVLLRLPAGLTDRLTARCALGPFSEAETARYVLGRLTAARATTPLFGPEELAALHMAADGLPRRLNRLADLALLIAYARDEERPSIDTIEIAAQEAGFADPLVAC